MADARDIIISDDENSGSQSAGGALELVSSLNFYSKLIYFITKQERLANLRHEMSPQEAKAQFKTEKDFYKKNVDELTANSEKNGKLSRPIKVYRRQNGVGDRLKDEDSVEALAVGSGVTFMDFIITFFRSYGQVFFDVLQRQDNVSDGSRDNPDSLYTQLIYQNNGDPESGLSPIGGTFLGLSLLAPVLGMARGIYQMYRKIKLSSLAYYSKRKNKISASDEQAEQNDSQLEVQLEERLKQAMKDKTLSVHLAFPKQPLAAGRRTFLDDMADAVEEFYDTDSKKQFAKSLAKIERIKTEIKLVKDKVANGEVTEGGLALARAELAQASSELENERKSKPVRIAASIFRTIYTAVSTIWDRLSTYSYIFWVVWMPFVIACGLAAASGPMLPFVLLITLTIGTAFTVMKLFHINPLEIFFPKKQESKPADVTDPVKAEFERLVHETKLLEFIDAETRGIAETLGLANAKAKSRHTYKNPAAQSELRYRLLGSVHERRGRVAIAGFRKFLSGLLNFIFIGWLGSAMLGYFGASLAADFVGGTPLGGIGGAIVGIFTSVVAMTQLRKQQLEYEQKVDAILQSPYRGTDETKADAFQRLYEQVEFRKSLIKKYLAENEAKVKRPKHFDELDEGSKALFERDVAHQAALKDYLAKIDVFNDRYFEKFEHEAGAFTWAKKVLNRVYEFVFATQTGAFTTRFLLLKGGLLAGALGFSVFAAAAMWPFLVVAGIAMLVMGTIALIDYQMKVNQAHRENFLNTLDARIYYLETKNDELFAIQRQHNVCDKDASELEVAAEPVIEPKVTADVHAPAALASVDDAIAASDFTVEPDDAVDSHRPDEGADLRRPDESRDSVSPGVQLPKVGHFATHALKARMLKVELPEGPAPVVTGQSLSAASAA